MFGDDEPEDAWHPDDDLSTMVDNLHRRMDLLDRSTARGELRLTHVREDLEFMSGRWPQPRDGPLAQRIAELRARVAEHG